jgi:hypothetical protein
MKLKDATRCLGSVGTLLPLVLIFLIADAAYACPGTQSRVVYRTRTVNSRSMPMATTVITYGGSNARCGDSDSMYTRRNVRYVAARADRDYSPRYVAVRNVVSYRPVRQQVRYVAIRNADLDDAGRYVPIDRYQTDTGYRTRYAAVRSGYRRGNGIIGYVDVDNSAPRYAAVRTVPVYERRYVAVRNMDDDDDYVMPQRRYVAVRNVDRDCTCGAALQGSLDQIETVRPRHIVVKTDELAGTQEVIVPNSSYDDSAYVAVPTESVNRTYVGYSNAAYVDDNDEAIIPAGYTESPCVSSAALSNCSGDEAVVRTVKYVPAYDDNDLDDQAILDTDNAAYVADDDVGDACLKPEAYYQESPQAMMTQEVNYVPARYVDEDASLSGSGTAYVVADNSAPSIRYVPVTYDNDSDVDADTTYVSDDDVGNSCSCPVAFNTIDSNVDMSAVNYVPATEVENLDADNVSYEPVESAGDSLGETFDYPVAATHIVTAEPITADDNYADTMEVVPAEGVAVVTTDESPTFVTNEVTEPAFAAEDSAVITTEPETEAFAAMTSTEKIGGDTGYRDGFEAGKATALNMQQFHPSDSVDFQNGTAGYEDTYGDMDVYRNAFRSSYLQGYSEGFNSIVAAG